MPVTSQSQLNWNDIREDVKRSMEAAFKRNFFPGLFIFVLALFIVFLYYFDEEVAQVLVGGVEGEREARSDCCFPTRPQPLSFPCVCLLSLFTGEFAAKAGANRQRSRWVPTPSSWRGSWEDSEREEGPSAIFLSQLGAGELMTLPTRTVQILQGSIKLKRRKRKTQRGWTTKTERKDEEMKEVNKKEKKEKKEKQENERGRNGEERREGRCRTRDPTGTNRTDNVGQKKRRRKRRRRTSKSREKRKKRGEEQAKQRERKEKREKQKEREIQSCL